MQILTLTFQNVHNVGALRFLINFLLKHMAGNVRNVRLKRSVERTCKRFIFEIIRYSKARGHHVRSLVLFQTSQLAEKFIIYIFSLCHHLQTSGHIFTDKTGRIICITGNDWEVVLYKQKNIYF